MNNNTKHWDLIPTAERVYDHYGGALKLDKLEKGLCSQMQVLFAKCGSQRLHQDLSSQDILFNQPVTSSKTFRVKIFLN